MGEGFIMGDELKSPEGVNKGNVPPVDQAQGSGNRTIFDILSDMAPFKKKKKADVVTPQQSKDPIPQDPRQVEMPARIWGWDGETKIATIALAGKGLVVDNFYGGTTAYRKENQIKVARETLDFAQKSWPGQTTFKVNGGWLFKRRMKQAAKLHYPELNIVDGNPSWFRRTPAMAKAGIVGAGGVLAGIVTLPFAARNWLDKKIGGENYIRAVNEQPDNKSPEAQEQSSGNNQDSGIKKRVLKRVSEKTAGVRDALEQKKASVQETLKEKATNVHGALKNKAEKMDLTKEGLTHKAENASQTLREGAGAIRKAIGSRASLKAFHSKASSGDTQKKLSDFGINTPTKKPGPPSGFGM